MDRDEGEPEATGKSTRWPQRRRCLAAVLAISLAGPIASCSDSEPAEPVGAASVDAGEPTEAREAPDTTPPFAVETTTLNLVDATRPTDHPDHRWDAPRRNLETVVYVPQGEGPFPLVVHAHGFNGHPRKFTQLVTAWAASGYVVALPTFPLTSDAIDAPGVLADYVNQPADVSFVIDQVLERAAGDDPVLGGQVDPQRIAVSGHSLGGIAVYAVAFNDCCRDDRVDAAVLMSTLPLPFEGGSYDFAGIPLLLLQLTEDPLVPYDAAVTTYDQASSPKFLVTLQGGIHAEPYEDAPSPHDEVVEETTIAFWDAYLADDPEAADRLVEAAESADGSSIAAEGDGAIGARWSWDDAGHGMSVLWQ